MQVTKKFISPTKVDLSVTVDPKLLNDVKTEVLQHLAKDHVKIQGFRAGKAPLALVERHADQQLLQSEFLDSALNRAYGAVLDHEKLRPVAQPEVKLTKFVPFTTLEFSAVVEVVGEVKLPDYKKIQLTKKPVKVLAKDVNDVLDSLAVRAADKKAATRTAKAGDEAIIDFAGVDAASSEPISGADGKTYPLLLGSGNFIPGFEDNIIGMKPGQEKTFTVTFPADYGVATLQKRKVNFTVTLQTLNEVVKPKLDDAFAAQVSPFKTLTELKDDIKKQVTSERTLETEREFQNELLAKIAEKTTAEIPAVLIENEIDRMEQEERQNLIYRGQTWEEHLQAEGVTNEEHRERQRDMATLRVKSGLMLAEIAEQEGVIVDDGEVDVQLAGLRAQYGNDQQMLTELEKPETRREIASRLVSEKTIAKLTTYATKN